jgi:hypothetical protein
MNLIGLDLNYAPKDKEQKTKPEVAESSAPQALLIIDRDFLLTLAIIVVLAGTFVTLSGMALASVARR